jgi:hypothetical protein
MTVTYAVTFEFPTRQPLTLRGTTSGSSASVCVSRATREAQKQLAPVAWSSVVCVLLERLDEVGDDPEPGTEAEIASNGVPEADNDGA